MKMAMLCRMLVAFVVLVEVWAPLSTAASASRGEISGTEAMRIFRNATNRTIRRVIIPKFRPILERQYPGLVDRIDVDVIPFADFNAFADYENRKILIPLGLVVSTDYVINGALLAYSVPGATTSLDSYVKYTAERYLAALKTGYDDVPIMQFWEYAEIDRGLAGQIMRREEYAGPRVGWITEALALVIAHEFGHHALRHKPSTQLSPANSRKQEEEADKFAVELLTKADMSVLAGATTTFVLFAAFESAGSTSTHPPAACRMASMARYGFEKANDELGGSDWLSKGNMTQEQLMQVFEELDALCEEERAAL